MDLAGPQCRVVGEGRLLLEVGDLVALLRQQQHVAADLTRVLPAVDAPVEPLRLRGHQVEPEVAVHLQRRLVGGTRDVGAVTVGVHRDDLEVLPLRRRGEFVLRGVEALLGGGDLRLLRPERLGEPADVLDHVEALAAPLELDDRRDGGDLLLLRHVLEAVARRLRVERALFVGRVHRGDHEVGLERRELLEVDVAVRLAELGDAVGVEAREPGVGGHRQLSEGADRTQTVLHERDRDVVEDDDALRGVVDLDGGARGVLVRPGTVGHGGRTAALGRSGRPGARAAGQEEGRCGHCGQENRSDLHIRRA